MGSVDISRIATNYSITVSIETLVLSGERSCQKSFCEENPRKVDVSGSDHVLLVYCMLICEADKHFLFCFKKK